MRKTLCFTLTLHLENQHRKLNISEFSQHAAVSLFKYAHYMNAWFDTTPFMICVPWKEFGSADCGQRGVDRKYTQFHNQLIRTFFKESFEHIFNLNYNIPYTKLLVQCVALFPHNIQWIIPKNQVSICTNRGIVPIWNTAWKPGF